MKERPDAVGLWQRDGVLYLVSQEEKTLFAVQLTSAFVRGGSFLSGALPTGNWQQVYPPPSVEALEKRALKSVLALMRADHHDHFESRTSDSEMEAIREMRLINQEARSPIKAFAVVKQEPLPPEVIAITTGWPETNRRRGELIDKKVARTITTDERAELNKLQSFASARQNLFAPLPMEQAEAALEDALKATIQRQDEEIAGLKRERDNFENAAGHLAEMVKQPPPPEVIVGEGQAVTKEQEGVYACEEIKTGVITVYFKTPDKHVHSCFCHGHRYIRIGPLPTFPPRESKPAFVPPPKPELLYIRLYGMSSSERTRRTTRSPPMLNSLTGQPAGWYLCEANGDELNGVDIPLLYDGENLCLRKHANSDRFWDARLFTNFRPLIEKTPDLVRVKPLVFSWSYDKENALWTMNCEAGMYVVSEWESAIFFPGDEQAMHDVGLNTDECKRVCEWHAHYRERIGAAVERVDAGSGKGKGE